MPIPILGWAVGAIVVVAAGGYNWWNNNKDNSSNDKNKKFEYGSTIIIGPQQSGKTHLANWLVNEKLLDSYIPTTNKVEIGEFTDIRGGEIQVNDWENLIREKKNIFYLFDMEKFINKNEYAKTTYNDIVIKHISIFTENFKPKGILEDKKFIVIGTHFDKIDNSKVQNIIDIIHNELGTLEIIYGSLTSNDEAYKLEKEIQNIIKD
ncbi:hypothetical protein [Aliarcobacter butzleri]|uniref:hypothetical protein n=1 Tax=Aliarcobacter butzleri TaxID=28197 RepID=UPI00125EA38F|nr:hypothetical protein [Aliarcobacter butzleri]